MAITPRGPNIITGGAFGPDGGLVETAVLLIGIGAVGMRILRETQRHSGRVPSTASD